MWCCPNCGGALSCSSTNKRTAGDTCRACGFNAAQRYGITCFAPALANSGECFDPRLFELLARVEETNFWFVNRAKLIVHLLKTYFPFAENMLEVGCGTGSVLLALHHAMPKLQLVGSELHPSGLEIARRRVHDSLFVQMDARRIPAQNEFDVIGAFDVLEHIPEDESVLGNIHRALKPGGGVLISVPQHAWLWSTSDEIAHHVRRYGRGEMEAKLTSSGFRILRSTSFTALLLPAMMASRLFRRSGSEHKLLPELEISGWLNSALSSILRFEVELTRRGVDWPFGGSRVVVAQRL